jgi:TraM recognition site of TraD and TraG
VCTTAKLCRHFVYTSSVESGAQPNLEKKSTSAVDEVVFLHERIVPRLKPEQQKQSAETYTEVHKELKLYAQTPADQVLVPDRIPTRENILRDVLHLEPDAHDDQVKKIVDMIEVQGIKYALSVVAELRNPHLEDDVHRALVRYVAEKLPIGHTLPSAEVWRALHMVLFEIQPQPEKDEQGTKPLQVALQKMEQLYTSLLTIIADGKSHVSLELAVPEGTQQARMYIAVPKDHASLFGRFVSSVYPNAKVLECPQDYNIFIDAGTTVGYSTSFAEHGSLPLKLAADFEHDPLNILLAAFSNIEALGEGCALQIVLGSEGEHYNNHYRKIAQEIGKGESFKKAIKIPETKLGEFATEVFKSFFDTDEKKEHKVSADTHYQELIQKKIKARIVPVTMRLVASARTAERARALGTTLGAALAQFDEPAGNHLVIQTVSDSHLPSFLRAFTQRTFDSTRSIPLSLSELATIYHTSVEGGTTSRELEQVNSAYLQAPLTLATDGIILGTNTAGGKVVDIHFADTDRVRHFYTVGQTGAGKSTLLKKMIIQDIVRGEGVCFIDPHGHDIEEILAAIPPEREKDVIYFDPAHTEMPMGLNMFEYDYNAPEQKTLVVNEVYDIFRQLYADVPDAFGPMFEQYYRNATMLVVEDPATGNTMVEVSRVLSDAAYRKLKLSRCGNPLVVQFWEKIAGAAGGEASLENVVPYITSKFDVFLANDIMRPIVAQETSAFNFREMMDGRKIFLANLSKGKLGARNASLLGLIIVSKFLQAALSRTGARTVLPTFYLYIDEFQNFTTPSIATILSEARKYKLSLNVAHQYIAQLDEKIRDAIFGNVGTKCVFRVAQEDAEFLVKSFEPHLKAQDLTKVENLNAYLAPLIHGQPSKPMSLSIQFPPHTDTARVDFLRQQSYARYGRPRAEIEEEIALKFAPQPQSMAPVEKKESDDWFL